jgi:hypothetical protein
VLVATLVIKQSAVLHGIFDHSQRDTVSLLLVVSSSQFQHIESHTRVAIGENGDLLPVYSIMPRK